MKLKSHIKIAKMIADLLEQHMNVKIDRDSMELGAVYPDMQLIRRMRIHNSKKVCQNYEVQSRNFINRTNRLSFSFSIGMLSHYICDSFCYAHNKPMKGYRDFKEHVSYEWGLYHAIEAYEPGDHLSETIRMNAHRCMDFDVENFIQQAQKEYLQKNQLEESSHRQFINDIEYSIVTSVLTMMAFVIELDRAKCPVLENVFTESI